MSAKFASIFDSKYIVPADRENFFDTKENRDAIRNHEKRERPGPGFQDEHCKENLFFGFFHDGTCNNLRASLQDPARRHTESNVGRLYLAYPGKGVEGVLPDEAEWTYKPDEFKNYFRVYTPGVGTKFPEVNDGDKGVTAKLGAAAAYFGERRIIWTLAQAINNLHRYFLNSELISKDDILNVCVRINLNAYTLKGMKTDSTPPEMDGSRQDQTPREAFTAWLKKLHAAIRLHMPDSVTGSVQKIDPGIVKEIYVSVFGFSRGATSARVFTNWLITLCELDAELLGKAGTTLGGFPVNFDFLGIFDTVASVGLANTLGFFEGHHSWADSELSLRVPPNIPCLHLVSAHEVRRSFPLDSISIKNSTSENHQEIVYPGVHSDVGGGYPPLEQGKGADITGKDMLSRIPLAHMYRAARLAGVPLWLELAQNRIKENFKIDPAVIEAFNTYVRLSNIKDGTLTEIMRDQRKYYIQWRLARRTTLLENTRSFEQAREVDQNDLKGANDEFENEIKQFEEWLIKQELDNETVPKVHAAGFDNSSKNSEWEAIAQFWDQKLPDGMAQFFDHYVHDSRAWFKLSAPEADEVEGILQDWVRIKNQLSEQPPLDGFERNPLTPEQIKYATEYEKTNKVPRMPTGGREVLNGAGYLRYRRIYSGGDAILLSHSKESRHDQVAKNSASKDELAIIT